MFKRITMIAWLVGLSAFAQSISAIADETPIRLAGRLTKITGKTLTITTDHGTATAITCNDATKLGRDGVKSAVKLTDLKVGQPVRAYYTKPENIAIAIFIETSQERPKRPADPKLPAGVKVLRDLQYVEGGHERNRLDLYLPEKAEGQLPLVVWIHGGAWWAGSKQGCPAVF